MLRRALMLVLALAVVLAFSPVVLAEKADDKTAEGTVVKTTENKLTIADKEKTEHTCEVAQDAKITCNGKECKLEDLKKGVKVKVTVSNKKATKIVATTE